MMLFNLSAEVVISALIFDDVLEFSLSTFDPFNQFSESVLLAERKRRIQWPRTRLYRWNMMILMVLMREVAPQQEFKIPEG